MIRPYVKKDYYLAGREREREEERENVSEKPRCHRKLDLVCYKASHCTKYESKAILHGCVIRYDLEVALNGCDKAVIKTWIPILETCYRFTTSSTN